MAHQPALCVRLRTDNLARAPKASAVPDSECDDGQAADAHALACPGADGHTALMSGRVDGLREVGAQSTFWLKPHDRRTATME
jgi:hypothetical protein